ncbi:MAG: SLC13 family permease [Gemmatimonadota bacterium]|nr:SLC13 family permease [Gemmatimonadota bacterium]
MTFDIVFVLVVAAAALVLFAMDRIRLDQLSMSVPVVLLLGGIIGPAEALSGLSSEATVTVAAMLVLGLGLRKTGLVAAIGIWARTAPLGGKTLRMFILCLLVAFLSPFLNNTAVVIVFIPVFAALADQAGEPVSMYLMPLSFVAIMGGDGDAHRHRDQPGRARGGDRARLRRTDHVLDRAGRAHLSGGGDALPLHRRAPLHAAPGAAA